MPSKPIVKKPIPSKPQAVKPAQKNVVQKKPAPDKAKGLHLLKEEIRSETTQLSPDNGQDIRASKRRSSSLVDAVS
jgi:hypothetical protein